MNQKLGPGDITQMMALPWQADLYECEDIWWPSHRPDFALAHSAANVWSKKTSSKM